MRKMGGKESEKVAAIDTLNFTPPLISNTAHALLDPVMSLKTMFMDIQQQFPH